MASPVNIEDDALLYATLPDWRKDNTRNLRSNAKAEKVLGVSSYNVAHLPPRPMKKKANPLGFSLFSDIKDALPKLNKKTSRMKIQVKSSDTESLSSTPSPTFDPAASNTSLSTAHSTPMTPKKGLEASSQMNHMEPLSQTEIIKAKMLNMPPIQEHNQLTYLAMTSQSDLEPTDPGSRKGSNISAIQQHIEELNGVATQSALTKLDEMNRIAPSSIQAADLPPPLNTAAGRHVQDWLETAQLDRRPSMLTRSSVLTRSSSLPVPELNLAAFSSSSDSIQTLTSETKSGGTSTPQWPLVSSPRRPCRIKKSDLRLESVLSLSSDEEDSDDATEKRRSVRTVRRRSNTPSSHRVSRYAHQREESNASSVIQLDSRPIVKPPTLTTVMTPKRSLADIVASAAGRPFSTNSWETDFPTESQQLQAVPETAPIEDFVVSPIELDTPTQQHVHPLWRSSAGSFDIDIRMSRSPPPPTTLQPLLEEEIHELMATPDRELMATPEEEVHAEINFTDFPVPPRSRSGSIVPSIYLQSIEKMPLPPATPPQDTILLSPSLKSRSGSIASEHSVALRPSVQYRLHQELGEKHVRAIDGTMRKRSLSNIPLYVTGLESSMDAEDGDDEDMAFFVYSSIF